MTPGLGQGQPQPVGLDPLARETLDQPLSGQPLVEGLPGQWIQPYWLWLTAQDAGGSLAVEAEEGRVVLTAHMVN